jgi:hypothetical protein
MEFGCLTVHRLTKKVVGVFVRFRAPLHPTEEEIENMTKAQFLKNTKRSKQIY